MNKKNKDINNLEVNTDQNLENETLEQKGSEIARQIFQPLEEKRKNDIRKQISDALDEVLSSDQEAKEKFDYAMNSLIKKIAFDAIIEKGESESKEEMLKAALKIFEKIKI